jgi:hypothetical protein
MKKLLIGLLLVFTCVMPLLALELKEGRMRLVVDERSGRFIIYYQTEANAATWLPLLYDQENKTTYPTLLVDQRTFKLGESSDFRTQVSKLGSTVVIEYRSAFCTVIQTISFLASKPGMAANGVLIKFEITNTAERDASIGLRFLFDTWLGEQNNRHFLTDSGTLLTNETVLRADTNIKWVVSPKDAQSGTAFFVEAKGQRPDSIILANWKRLNDVPWSFDSQPNRNFTLLPYSINDSAIAYFYNAQTLRRGASREIFILMGAAYTGDFQTEKLVDAKEAGVTIINQLVSEAEKVQLNMELDLLAAKELLDRINTLMDGTAEAEIAELELIQKALDKLEQRQGSY